MAAVVGVEPVKSAEDRREYRIVTLPNDLKCILVSDPDTDKEAAAMDVQVGHFSDPDDLPGLAHFLEHMLFLGTKKYPDENSFSGFLNRHSGSSNAYTSSENTNYHFDVTRGHLMEALDRFAQFFVAPLFTDSATDRELKAVENEHQKNLQNDTWRIHQLRKSTANQKMTAITKFGTGNLQTLSTVPASQGIDTRAALIKFYETFYSSNVMCLCIYGADALDALQAAAIEMFSAVPNRNVTVPQFSGPAFDHISLQKLYRVVPVKDKRVAHIVWDFPATEPFYRTQPPAFLAHLLGHEAEGSILSTLKKNSWATGLSAGESMSASGFSLFSISIDLTPEGLHHTDEIFAVVFQYIRLLQAADSETLHCLYTERKIIGDLKFRFKGKEPPYSLSTQLSRDLQKVDPVDVLSCHYVFHEFDEPLIRRFVSYLVVDRARFEVVSKTFDSVCDQRERWYGTAYAVEPMGSETLARCASGSTHSLHLPNPNKFLATNFELVNAVDPNPVFDSAPTLVLDIPNIKLWYKPDAVFGKPKINVMAQFSTRSAYLTPRSAVECQLFTKLLTESLNEIAYDAELAGLSYSLDAVRCGLELRVRGYSEKLHVLLDMVVDRMAALEIDEQRFAMIHETTKRALLNFALEQPYQHSLYQQAMATECPRWGTDLRLAVIDDITARDIDVFRKDLLGHGRWEVFVHGNTVSGRAIEFGKQIIMHIPKGAALPADLWPEQRVVELPAKSEVLHAMQAANPNERNSSALVYFQIGRDEVALRARLRLLAHLGTEPCFNRLRTIETLGYLVFSGMQEQFGVLGYRFIVQSSEYSPLHLRSRILAFVNELRGIIATGLSDSEFDANRDAVVARRLEKDKTLSDETKRIWSQIHRHRYEFSARSLEADEISKLSRADILSFFDEYIAESAVSKRMYTSLVFGTEHPFSDDDLPGDVHVIKDVSLFKRSCSVFPAFE
ncbi:Insulin-degrading enzyme [Plasmodiophora brassicae]